uniref:CRABS CLAW protein n=1 Tax=Macrostomum lignano TaxID=282301 RepID=A0A1I8FGN3_9PLAT
PPPLCGGYREGLNPGQSFTLTSPNYTQATTIEIQRCIGCLRQEWHGFRINVNFVSLEGNSAQHSTGCNHGMASSVATEPGLPGARQSWCDNINDCGCDELWLPTRTKVFGNSFLTTPVGLCGALGMGIGLTLSIAVFIICGFVEDAGAQKARVHATERAPTWGLPWAGAGPRTRCSSRHPEDAFMAMMKRMTAGKSLQWEGADSDEVHHSKQQSRRRLPPELRVGRSALGSRRSSVYAPTYGNTLSRIIQRQDRRRRPTTAACQRSAADGAETAGTG